VTQAVERPQTVSGDAAGLPGAVEHPARPPFPCVDPVDTTRILREALEAIPASPVTVCVTGVGPGIGPGDPDALGAAELADFLRWDVLSRGHRLNVLLGRSWTGGSAGAEGVRALAEAGARVRVLAGAPPAILTLGGELALVRAAGAQPDAGTRLVRGAEVVAAVQGLQLALWERGVELALARLRPAGHPVLDETQARVLRKLCDGVKDEAAARQMNVSVRTYRRHVAGILRILDVASRFEAGIRVAELGLLPGPARGR
jgi:DNA-binding NarL/FixJ family response regulator